MFGSGTLLQPQKPERQKPAESGVGAQDRPGDEPRLFAFCMVGKGISPSVIYYPPAALMRRAAALNLLAWCSSQACPEMQMPIP